MKKIYFAFLLSCITASAFSQISVSVGGNYTAYKGDFGKSTPGAQVRIGYSASERITTQFGFTYGIPIKESSSVTMMDDIGNSIDVASKINYRFKTFSLLANYKLIGDDESTVSLYGQLGAGFVLVSYDEKITGSYDQNTYKYPQNQIEKTSESGFTLNFGAGAEFKVGLPVIFAEAGLALPANQVGNTYVENVIPAHFTLNLGVRIPFGGGNY